MNFKQRCCAFWKELRDRYDWVIAIDGAFQKNPNSRAKAGIGGVIRSNVGDLEYIFSGPSDVSHASEAEKEACMHVIKVLSGKSISNIKIVICSDSVETIKYMERQKYEVDLNVVHNLGFIAVIDQVNFKVINRAYNYEADGLAKD